MAEEVARASRVADGAGESRVANRAGNLPIGAGTALGGLFQAVAAIYNTHQQIKWEERALISDQEFKRTAASTRFSRELQLEAVRGLRQRDLAELESRLRQDDSLREIQNRVLFDTYPVADGPGHLRESLRLLSPDLSSLPLVVLLPEFGGPEEGQWAGLRHAVAGSLRRELASDGQVVVYDGLRALSWPHASFYWKDLYGIPALIVQVNCYRDTLDVNLGGCHLRPGLEAPGEPLRSVYPYQPARDDSWTREVLGELDASVPSGRRLEEPGTDADRARLAIEAASRAVTAVTAAAVDVYYLGICRRYRERFDHAAAMLGQAPLSEWPADLAVPIEQVADPAFHLLHVAQRLLARNLLTEALLTVRQSLAALTHPDYALTDGPFPALGKSAGVVASGDDDYRQMLRGVLTQATQRLREDQDREQEAAQRHDLDELRGVLGE